MAQVYIIGGRTYTTLAGISPALTPIEVVDVQARLSLQQDAGPAANTTMVCNRSC